VNFFTSHLNPDAVIWTTNPEEVPLDPGAFCVGWSPDEVSPGVKQDPDTQETMFIVQQSVNNQDNANGLTDKFQIASEMINRRTCLIVIVGAGIGCDSNLPDYRSPNGFWKQYPPLQKLGLSLQDMSQADWFEKDPTMAWGFYSHRQHLYKNTTPHEGFKVLLDLCKSTRSCDPESKEPNYFVITSNVDSQFNKAGFASERIFETHGTLAYLQCTKNCSGSSVWKNDGGPLEIIEETMRVKDEATLPRCEQCGHYARPNVSFFSDTTESFNPTRQEQQKQSFFYWFDTIKSNPNEHIVVMEIGCGTSIHSLRYESEVVLYHTPELNDRVELIRINPMQAGVGNAPFAVGIPQGSKQALLRLQQDLSVKISETKNPS